MRLLTTAGLATICFLALAGCGWSLSSDPGPAADGSELQLNGAAPDRVRCSTQYRPDAEEMTGAESPVLTVNRGDEPGGTTATHTFPTMELAVTYTGDVPEGNNLRLEVSDGEDEPLLSNLYQLAASLGDVNLGGHGFTGLMYVHNGEAMLQVWCDIPA